MIYTILIEKNGAVIAAQETFASWDDAIGDVIDYGYEAHAILELQEDGTTQACTDGALECFIEQYLDEQKEA
jgi:hypothetical protein